MPKIIECVTCGKKFEYGSIDGSGLAFDENKDKFNHFCSKSCYDEITENWKVLTL